MRFVDIRFASTRLKTRKKIVIINKASLRNISAVVNHALLNSNRPKIPSNATIPSSVRLLVHFFF